MVGHLVADLLVVDLLELKARDPDALDTHVLEETTPLTTKSLKGHTTITTMESDEGENILSG